VRREAVPRLFLSALLEPGLRLRSQIGHPRYPRLPLRTQALRLLRQTRVWVRGRARIAYWPFRRSRCLAVRELPMAMGCRAPHANSEQRTRHGLPPPDPSRDGLGAGGLPLREPPARARRPVRALRLVLKIDVVHLNGRLERLVARRRFRGILERTPRPATPCRSTGRGFWGVWRRVGQVCRNGPACPASE